ncbi:LIM domain-binding protein 2 [Nephila pilipes]|uniref:LIM domain-binding protein 2 n=1 Tax=Nephila pilipes TaxID=299642 RepID=A0A8X6R0K8_NEPPI|nr:LIM domain-binding protein 2 [Nephila pilipes]
MKQMFSQPIPGGPAMDPFYSSPFSSYFRRQTPYFGQPDYRIYEMNKRLQQRTDASMKSELKPTALHNYGWLRTNNVIRLASTES